MSLSVPKVCFTLKWTKEQPKDLNVAGGNVDMQESPRSLSKSHSSHRPSMQALLLRGILASALCPQCLPDLPNESQGRGSISTSYTNFFYCSDFLPTLILDSGNYLVLENCPWYFILGQSRPSLIYLHWMHTIWKKHRIKIIFELLLGMLDNFLALLRCQKNICGWKRLKILILFLFLIQL